MKILQIYTSGATNIFKYPELSDSKSASELIEAFEEKQELASLVSENLLNSEENTGIQVYIGNETPIQTMKDCSVVTATYELGEGIQGTIGIVGPKRMDYENVMDNLKTFESAVWMTSFENRKISIEKGGTSWQRMRQREEILETDTVNEEASSAEEETERSRQ